MRVALYMATIGRALGSVDEGSLPRGKLGKVALVACMRKLLGIVNAKRRDELRAEGVPVT